MQEYEKKNQQKTDGEKSAGQMENTQNIDSQNHIDPTTVSVGIVVYLLVNVASASGVFAHLLAGSRESHCENKSVLIAHDRLDRGHNLSR